MFADFHLGRADRVRFDAALRGLPISGHPDTQGLFLFLEGLRLERLGDAREAERYYRWAVGTDATRDWPSVLAERKTGPTFPTVTSNSARGSGSHR
jgi:hypothetical protein